MTQLHTYFTLHTGTLTDEKEMTKASENCNLKKDKLQFIMNRVSFHKVEYIWLIVCVNLTGIM